MSAARWSIVAALAVAGIVVAGRTASAQTQGAAPLPVPGTVTTERGERLIDVMVNYSFNLPVTSDEPDAQRQVLERGRQMIYDIAAKECRVMQASFAATCRMERINVQANVQRQGPGIGPGMMQFAHVTGNAGYKVSIKNGP